MRYLTTIALFAFVLIPGASSADKASEALEKPWSRIQGLGSSQILADQNENEGVNNTCPGDPYLPGDLYHAEINPHTDVDWITFQASAGENLVAGTEADTLAGPGVDTIISLYEPDCATLIATDDDSGPGLFSLIDLIAPYTGTYNLKIESYLNSSGFYQALVTSDLPPTPPANDTCSGAIAIQPCTASPYVDSGSTATATNDYDPQGALGCACNAAGTICYAEAGRDVTYSLDLQVGDVLSVEYTNTTDGSVYLVTDCNDVPGSCVAGSDKALAGGLEGFAYSPQVDGMYYLICDSYGAGTGGDYTLTVTFNCAISVNPDSWGRIKAQYR